MGALLSLLATLIMMGVAFALLHWLLIWTGVSDLIALLTYALPISLYVAWCTQDTRAATLRSAMLIFGSFAAVVLAAAGLVFLIGN